MSDDSLATLASYQALLSGWAVNQLGKALLVASLVALAGLFVIGVFAFPLAGFVAGWYLVASCAPTADDAQVSELGPLVVDE